jgi:hypothetical protein
VWCEWRTRAVNAAGLASNGAKKGEERLLRERGGGQTYLSQQVQGPGETRQTGRRPSRHRAY